MKVLLEKGADPNLGVNGLTPIMAVTVSVNKKNQSRGIECAKLLIKSGLPIENGPTSNQRTLLTQVVHKKLPSMLEYFLEVGANPNLRDNHGGTPLNYAVSKNCMVMIESLRKHGANPFIENLNGQSCLDIAKIEGNEELAEALLSWRRSYYKEKFNKNKDKFVEMLADVNAGCLLYSRRTEINKSNNKNGDFSNVKKRESLKQAMRLAPSPMLKDGEYVDQPKNEDTANKRPDIRKGNKRECNKPATRFVPSPMLKNGEYADQPENDDAPTTKLLQRDNESISEICREERVDGCGRMAKILYMD